MLSRAGMRAFTARITGLSRQKGTFSHFQYPDPQAADFQVNEAADHESKTKLRPFDYRIVRVQIRRRLSARRLSLKSYILINSGSENLFALAAG